MMSSQNLATAQSIQMMEEESSDIRYQSAKDFFLGSPLLLSPVDAFGAEIPNVTDQGAIQFHLIGQKPDDPKYSDIMNENQDNLLAIGGLVHNYMTKHHPGVNTNTLSIQTWQNVIDQIPDVTIGKNVRKTYYNSIAGVTVSSAFLTMIAKAVITDGASLLTDFTEYLGGLNDLVFTAHTKGQTYKVLNCVYHSYLVSNGVGGYYDYGAIVLQEVDFVESFMEIKSSCSTAEYINVNMSYTEIVSPIITRNIRQSGRDYERFQTLINQDATQKFKDANNFFNGGNTPQHELDPQT